MKTQLMAATLAAFTFTLPALTVPAHAAVPLPLENGNFEEGLKGWTAEKEAGMFAVSPEAASPGKAGLRIADESDRAAGRLVSAALPVVEGHIYALDFWGRLNSAAAGTNISLEFQDEAGKVLKGAPVTRYYAGASVKYDGAFEHYDARAGAPAGAKTVRVAVETWSRSTSNTDIDDLRLHDMTDGVDVPVDVPALTAQVKAARAAGQAMPKIVIKVDDLKQVNDRIYPKWQRFADEIQKRKIKAGIGIVFESLEQDAPKYVAWIKGLRDTGLFEFWNHGYDHKQWEENGKTLQEFKGPSYEQQKQHLTRANQLSREKLGFPMRSFGAPFNSIDETTIKVLSEDPDIQVVMYADKVPGKVALPRVFAVNIENPTFVANFPALVEGYAHNLNSKVFVLQGHPNQWDDKRFENFVQILDFLQAAGSEFAFASDFAPKN